MGSPRKVLTTIAMGASLLAFATLGSANAGEKAQKEGCCDVDAGACCAASSGQPGLGTVLLARYEPGATLKAAPRRQDKASPASLAKGVLTRKALLAQVSSLMEDGVADCCIMPGCGFCVIAADGCDCAASLAKNGPVCPECWGGWQAGQGMLPDVEPGKVQILPKDILKTLYEQKAKKLEAAGKKE